LPLFLLFALAFLSVIPSGNLLLLSPGHPKRASLKERGFSRAAGANQ
jgi:hypothetical protein